MTWTGRRKPSAAFFSRSARALALSSFDSQTRSWPHMLGPSLRSEACQVATSIERAPQPYSTMDADAALFAERQIVALADIVEAEQLHHDVVHGVLAGLDEGEAVVTRIEVEEPRDERMIV